MDRTRRQISGAGKVVMAAAVVVVLPIIAAVVIQAIANRTGSETTAAATSETWQNTDPNPRLMVKIDIAEVPGGLTIHPWGACLPTPCDWGSQMVNVSPGASTWDVHWSMSFSERDQHYTRVTDRSLNVTTHTHFTDNSGRADYDSNENFVLT
jgi:hypothetical protein